MRHKYGSYYADWRDHFGKRHMKAFKTARAARAFPAQAGKARHISPPTARAAITDCYLRWHPGAAPLRLARLFRWSKTEAIAAVESARAGG